MRVDHLTAVVLYWYTVVVVPLFYVSDNLDVNILSDSAFRAIAGQLPRLEVTKYVYPTLGNAPTSPEYELAPPAYENCKHILLVTHWPTYIVCDIMELAVLEMERRDAAAADSAVNLTLPASVDVLTLGPSRAELVLSSTVNHTRHANSNSNDVELRPSTSDDLFTLSAILYVLPFWIIAYLFTKLLSGRHDRDQELVVDALEEQQAGWMWRLAEQDDEFAEYAERTDGFAALVGEMVAERNSFMNLVCSGELLSDRLGARADAAKFALSAAIEVYVERESARQREISRLHVVGDILDVKLAGLYDRLDAERRDAAEMQEAADERALRVKEQIDESQAKLEVVTGSATLQAAKVASLASTLATLHADATDLETSNDTLREKVAHLYEARAFREHTREDEITSLRQSLLSTQGRAEVVATQEVAVSARVAALQATWTSTASAACQMEHSLQTILYDKREEIATLSNIAAAQATKTAALVEAHTTLESAYAEKKTLIASLTSRITDARDYISQLLENRAVTRRTREHEISTLAATTNALRSEHSATTATLESTKADIAHAQANAATDLAVAQATLDATRAEHKKAVAALEAKIHRRSDRIARAMKGNHSLQEQIAAVDAARDALEARFVEEEPEWSSSRERLEAEDAEQAERLEAARGRWAEAEDKKLAAEAQAAEANEAADAAEARSKADTAQLKAKMATFQSDLGVLRARQELLAADRATLKAEHDPLDAECMALRDKLVELPAAQDARLEGLEQRVLAAEAARNATNASRTVSSAIRQRTAQIQNAQDTVDLLAAASVGLDAQLSDVHADLHAEKEKLYAAQKARDAAVNKVRALQALLVTPTPPLAHSPVGFLRSPSLTPPPQTPTAGVLGDVVVCSPGEMDIVESSAVQTLYKA